ncbi:hypothetical protein PINS_up004777 [Pythium insidiosum]|nr:hypothetical protein PINS_up004777 [Pythium insidiosum]
MQFPQRAAPRSTRQRTRRKAETATVVGSTYHIRKSRSRWDGDVLDAMELASAPWEPSAQLDSLLNVQNISTMQEIYPTVALEVLEDVLVAAEFRIDVAVAMLTELVREQHQVAEMADPDVADMVIIDSQLLDEASETHWHDVAASRPSCSNGSSCRTTGRSLTATTPITRRRVLSPILFAEFLKMTPPCSSSSKCVQQHTLRTLDHGNPLCLSPVTRPWRTQKN